MDTEDEDFDASESQAEKTSLAGNLRPDGMIKPYSLNSILFGASCY